MPGRGALKAIPMDSAKLILTLAVFVPLLSAQSTGSISGVITNTVTSGGVEGVKVHAGCLSGATRWQDTSAFTDTAGAFRLAGLPEGRYIMSLQRDGFSAGLSDPLATVAASKEFRLDVKLTPLASVQGRVIDPDGKPVAGVMVESRQGPKAMTDEQGVFVIQKLAPGLAQLSAKVKPQPPGKDGERLVNTYYPSVIYADQAISIKVQGMDLSGYEIRLRTAPARSIRGILLDADGQPMPHASVVLATATATPRIPVIRGGVSPQFFLSVTTQGDRIETGPDGIFEFPAVLEGDWVLKGSKTDSGNRQGGSTEVRVGRSDIDNMVVRLMRLFPIEVTPESSDAQSTETPTAGALILPLDGQGSASTGVDAEPPFTQHLQGLPGRYLIGPETATPGYYVSAAMLNGRDVLWQVVELSGPTALKLILKKDAGTLRGSVEKGGGSTVVLMAESTTYARFGLTARCDPDGNFSIPDIPPGNYTAVAFQSRTILTQRDILTRFDSANGKRVKIAAGATESVTLRVN
ncbi:MAG: hypothetical protein ABI824_01670 [Acidobacteriota bacterium]